MVRMRLKIFLFSVFFLAKLSAQTGSHLQLISAMLDSIKKIQTARFKITAMEKMDNTYLKAISDIKLQLHPRKLYFINREKKLEILYVEGENDNKAVVKPHIFPYLTISLHPTGSLMRKNQHYTINELGFDNIGNSIAIALSKEKDNFAKSITYYGKQEKNGCTCHLFVYEAKTFPYTEYVVKEKETVTSIAVKLNLNEYMIRAKNALINDFGYLDAGRKLQVPLYYCKKAVVFIDEKTMLPVSVSVFDDKELLENYDFTNVIINQPIDPSEFTRSYKDYHF
jgi:hypothetical protein